MDPQNLSLVLRAISFAAREHLDQMRKDDETPYVAHPMRVMTIMNTAFGVRDPHLLATAVLHDTIEDTTADRDDLIAEFGERVAGYVAALSKDKRLPEDQREKRYFETLAQSPLEVKLCKLADTIDNLIDSTGLSPWSREKTIAKAEQLVELFAPDFPEEWRHALDRTRWQIDATAKGV